MHYNSGKSKKSDPMSSGPNMTGYYMGDSSSLLNMMQTGGQASAGAALLARSRQRRADREVLERIQKEEAERQKKGSTFGSLFREGAKYLGGAVFGPVGRVAGAYLGQKIGEEYGAGDPVDYDTSGTVYGQDLFEDVDEASEDYTKGIDERALVAGLETGVDTLSKAASLLMGGTGTGSEAQLMMSGLDDSFTPDSSFSGFTIDTPNITPSADIGPFSGPVTFDSQQYYDSFPSLTDSFGDNLTGGRGLSQDDVFPFQEGGSVDIQDILREAGIMATPNQLALFEKFDPSQLNKLKESMSQSLLGMSSGEGLASVGSGFGAQQAYKQDVIEGAQESLLDATTDSTKAFASKTLGEVARMEDKGVNFLSLDLINRLTGTGDTGSTGPQQTSPLDSPGEFAGQTINYNGQTYSWNGSEWQNQNPDPSFGLSDKRLKKNIESIGVSDSGINIYTFEYADEKHGKGRYKGVMAQEVPWATIPLDSGYLAVDYNKIDVDFERVN